MFESPQVRVFRHAPVHRRARAALVHIVAAAMVLAARAAGPATARAAEPGAGEPAPVAAKTLVLWESGAPADLLSDPKDAGLKRALALIPARLDQLRTEVKQFQMVPPQAVNLVLTLLSSPVRLAVVDAGADRQTGAPGIGVFLSLGMPDQQAATAMHRNIMSLLALAGGAAQAHDSQKLPGMTEIQGPAGAITFGAHQGDVGGGWSYDVLVGHADEAKAALAELPKARGGASLWGRGRLDLAAFTPVVEMIAAQAPNSAAVVRRLQASGLTGPDAMSFDLTLGHDQGWLTTTLVAHGMWKFHEADGLVREAITGADLAAAPADVTTCTMSKHDLGAIWRSFSGLLTSVPDAQRLLEEFKASTGVDPATDVVGALGTTFLCYMSDSTGGGGVLSLIAGVSVADRARLLNSADKLAASLNEEMDRPDTAEGYVQMTRWAEGGVDYVGIRFPGIPVPLEPTIAVTDKWALFGLTRSAATAAAMQATGKGDKGLGANEAFAMARAGLPAEAVSLNFSDSARVMRDTYGLMSLVGAALANGLRSPIDGARDPGLIVPTYSALRAGARPALSVSVWEGDDLVTRSRRDASILVSASGAYGAFAPIWGAAIGAGVLLPALGEARRSARLTIDLTHLKEIEDAVTNYAAAHDGGFPPDIQSLESAGLLDAEATQSPFGPVSDGRGDYFLRPAPPAENAGRVVVAYGRAAFAQNENVPVVFADGAVQVLKKADFLAIVNGPAGAGVDWQLPGASRKRVQPRP